MADFEEQHVCTKFFFKPDKAATEIFEMVKRTFWEETISRTHTFY
jgi:hypothetical protein